MAALTWDATGQRWYETGTDRGVLYVLNNGTYGDGVAWNGLTAVTDSPSGAEANDIYADNIKYVTLRSAETLGLTIEAYTYPDEFAECDGSKDLVAGVSIGQQTRSSFGFTYRTMLGNDQHTNSDAGYKIHIVYNCTASPSERSYQTINDSPEAITMSWEISTIPIETGIAGMKPTASVVIDSTKVDATKLTSFEAILYGDATNDARLPLPSEIKTHFAP